MQFTIRSRHDLPIRGDIHEPLSPRALIVLVHGFKGFKDWGFFPWLAERLCDEGYAVVRFNMSRSGIGQNPETFERLDLFAEDTYSGQLDDLRDVISFAQNDFPELPTFLLGHSRGGGVALLGARDVPQLAGVITWSAISRTDRWDEAMKRKWRADGYREEINARTKQVMRLSTAILEDVEAHRERLDVLAAARGLEVPLLVIHGERDESVPVAEGQQIADQGRDASLVVIGAASHTYNAIHPLIHVPFELSLAAEIAVRFIGAYA
jgi:pimeloyl-ACP methyl ester carboxylesterase